jgi:hypothetical protein
MTDPLPREAFDGSSLFEKVLNAFVLTNPDYFKGAPLLPDDGNDNPLSGDKIPGEIQPYKNDYVAFDIPSDWEVPPVSDPKSIMVTPVLDNATDGGEGITVLVMDRHNMDSDLAFSKSFVTKAEWVEYGKNKFARFMIANQGVQNFVISNDQYTYMITITTNKAELVEKYAKFLESIVLVKNE